jgi:hypothetical protein
MEAAVSINPSRQIQETISGIHHLTLMKTFWGRASRQEEELLLHDRQIRYIRYICTPMVQYVHLRITMYHIQRLRLVPVCLPPGLQQFQVM